MTLKIRGKQTGLTLTARGSLDYQPDGGVTQTIIYKCLWAEVFTYVPVRNVTASPDFPQLICANIHVEFEKPNLAVMTVTYQGIPGSSLPPGEEELTVSTGESPIETHPDFVDKIGGKKGAVKNGAIFDDDGAFIGWAADSKYAGVESYLVPSVVYRYTYASFSRPSVADVGKIRTPTGAPAAGSGRNWLLTGVTWRRAGGYYSINEEGLRSGPSGFDPTIYA